MVRATIEGVVVGVRLRETKKKKEYQSLQVMQETRNGALLVVVNDFNGNKYKKGDKFNRECIVSAWCHSTVAGRGGLNCNVLGSSGGSGEGSGKGSPSV